MADEGLININARVPPDVFQAFNVELAKRSLKLKKQEAVTEALKVWVVLSNAEVEVRVKEYEEKFSLVETAGKRAIASEPQGVHGAQNEPRSSAKRNDQTEEHLREAAAALAESRSIKDGTGPADENVFPPATKRTGAGVRPLRKRS
jgi:hypothetical protein